MGDVLEFLPHGSVPFRRVGRKLAHGPEDFGMVFAGVGSKNAVRDSIRECVGPLCHGRSADTNRLGGLRYGSPEDLNCVGFVHPPDVSGLTAEVKPANAVSWLNNGMTLVERLNEVMDKMQWDRAKLVAVSGQSSSVVSQWLGKGTKTIKTIGKIEAAMAIAQASGYSAVWIAKGEGPKKLPPPKPAVQAPPPPPYGYKDRHEVSESDWALLQDIKLAGQQQEIDAIRQRARMIEQRALELLESRKRAG